MASGMVKQVSPMLAVRDVKESIAFYNELFGFTVVVESPDYAVISRDGQSLHLMASASEEITRIVSQHTEIYIEVDDLQAFWARVQTHSGKYRVREPFDRKYGMTEFHIDDGNCLIFVGEMIKKP